jgi:hypothetical protein
MSTPAQAPAIPALKRKRLIQVALLAWFAMIGFDLLMNAGLLAHFYNWQLPGFLPPMKMFLYIPLGYAAFLLHAILILWLMVRMNVRGGRAGAIFGGTFGVLVGVAGFLGQMSIFAFPLTMLLCWAVFHMLSFILLGAVIGSGLAATRLRSLTRRVVALFLICLIVSIVMQNLGLVPAQRIPRGRVGIGWDPNR